MKDDDIKASEWTGKDWERVYEEKRTPWDVEEPEDSLVDLIKTGIIKPGKALEIGCGHGNDAIFLAKNGFQVTALDISSTAVKTARERAEKAGARIAFSVQDFTELSVKEKFDFVYDRACFHFIPLAKRSKYVENVKRVLKSGGYFILLASSDKDTIIGPYQFTKESINDIFGKDFEILKIELVTLEKHALKPTLYFCVMRRK